MNFKDNYFFKVGDDYDDVDDEDDQSRMFEAPW